MPEEKKRIFVVQEHNASHLHWDFRLEMNGSLRSWAIPKQPPVRVGLKRLAIEVENHPLSYANFEGKIPEGEYGAGTVKIWDKGNYELLDEKEEKIVFELHGEKMKGKYVLVKTKYQNQKSWLLFRTE
jgi:bifunctional non-homologous end joining protein LigD